MWGVRSSTITKNSYMRARCKYLVATSALSSSSATAAAKVVVAVDTPRRPSFHQRQPYSSNDTKNDGELHLRHLSSMTSSSTVDRTPGRGKYISSTSVNLVSSSCNSFVLTSSLSHQHDHGRKQGMRRNHITTNNRVSGMDDDRKDKKTLSSNGSRLYRGISSSNNGAMQAVRGYSTFSVGGLPYGGLRVDTSDSLIRRLELHMPENMNALDNKLMKHIQKHLTTWETNFMVKAVVLQGLESSFCSGLDIVSLYADPDKAAVARKKLCELASYLAYYEKPVVSIMDGSTIGAGYALCQGRYQIATQDGIFFVCEPSFGLGLEGGLSYVLPRLRGRSEDGSTHSMEAVGMCLALTGLTLTGPDLVYAGLASNYMTDRTHVDHFLSMSNQGMETGSVQAFRRTLEMCSELSNDQDEIASDNINLEPDYLKDQYPPYMDHVELAPPTVLHGIVEDITKAFDSNCDSVEQVEENLKRINEDWARQALRRMEKASPLALKVVFQQMRRGKSLTFNDALKMEYRVGNMLQRSEGYAATVAKIIQHNTTTPAPSKATSEAGASPPPPPPAPPSWWSKSLHDVTDAEVANILEGKVEGRVDYELPNLDFPIMIPEVMNTTASKSHTTTTAMSTPAPTAAPTTVTATAATATAAQAETVEDAATAEPPTSSSASSSPPISPSPPKTPSSPSSPTSASPTSAQGPARVMLKKRRFKAGGMEKIDVNRDRHPDRDSDDFVDVDKLRKDVWQ